MNFDLKNDVNGSETPVRISRIVSVILNGVHLNKLAGQHGYNAHVMATSLMLGLSETVQKSIANHEHAHVNHNLMLEIGRRINLPEAV
jgi:hypothetical protein